MSRGALKTLLLLLCFAVIFVFSAATPQKAQAQACCSCAATVSVTVAFQWWLTVSRVTGFVTTSFFQYQAWISQNLWGEHIDIALKRMTEQLASVAMSQVMMTGAFMDAKHQMETQQVFQKLQARVHKDYHPSLGLCTVGSTTKTLAASDRKSEYNSVLLSQRSQDRSLGHSLSAAAIGESSDINSRIKQYRDTFCDPADNNQGLDYLCDHDQTGPNTDIGAVDLERMNKDIDFARTVAFPWTLNIDFTDNQLTDHEEEILALASNLYGHNIFSRPRPESLRDNPDNLSQMQESYLDARAQLAKKSVAENSYNAITSMKAQGTPGSRDFMLAVVQELGLDAAQAGLLLGDGVDQVTDPSYYAQMEVLTKKLYQNPDFYTNLYDKPANVERKDVALQALNLMQRFDLFKSYLRYEASLAVLLELTVRDLQEEVENEFGRMAGGGTPAQ